jgi:sulfate permease, SulP family
MPRSIHEISSRRIPAATGLRWALRNGYHRDTLRADLVAGIVVGVVSLPLSMALAVAAGVAPEYGLYTAIIAGAVVALAGGSATSVTGPTAAFVVLLVPISARFGLAGLTVATLIAGLILVAMGALRFGRLIQFVPFPVTTGFTAGIAVVIALLQLGELTGIGPLEGEHAWDRVGFLFQHVDAIVPSDLALGLLTVALLVAVPHVIRKLPAPLVAMVAVAAVGFLVESAGWEVTTLADRFGGIPASLPIPHLPWQVGDGITLGDLPDLAASGFAIAVLGAIESLLCAVIADGMTGTRHDSDAELVGLGLGNVVAPFFGGFAATGAIARTATAIRSGARTPFTAVFHSVFILIAMVALAPLLGYLPMSALAGLLLIVAWNMADLKHVAHIVRRAPRSDVAVLVTCLVLTVAYDMVVAVGVGIVLAAFLFMRRMVEISGATLVAPEHEHPIYDVPRGVVVYEIAGPLFFGAAEKAFDALTVVESGVRVVVIDLDDVPAIDATGLVALESTIDKLNQAAIHVYLTGTQPQPERALERAGMSGRSTLVTVVPPGVSVTDVLAGLRSD